MPCEAAPQRRHVICHHEGTLTTRDSKRHIPHPFRVAAGAGRVEITFAFAPAGAAGISNLITLTLFDPTGFRGAGHRGGSEHRVSISPSAATPGYVPGPLPAGEWVAELDTHLVMPGEPLHYSLDVALSEERGAPMRSSTPRAPLQAASGWYRGDLHTHTDHSDADGRDVASLLRSAREEALDFIFLTDHNTVSGLPETDASCDGGLLAAGGVELTTYWGHALCLGARDWIDWRVRPNAGEMPRLARSVDGREQLFVIAHPMANGDPCCTGCAWRFGDMMPGPARAVEVWNGPWDGDSNNENALALWYDWLNQGLRLVATAGSDTHARADYGRHPAFSVVHADALSEAVLIRAIRAGHLYLSAGPHLSFDACGEDGSRAAMGDEVAGEASFSLHWADCASGALVRVMLNGRSFIERAADRQGGLDWRLSAREADWALVEVRAPGGEMLALTNPIYMK
jgi:hypothetical protein